MHPDNLHRANTNPCTLNVHIYTGSWGIDGIRDGVEFQQQASNSAGGESHDTACACAKSVHCHLSAQPSKNMQSGLNSTMCTILMYCANLQLSCKSQQYSQAPITQTTH